MRKLHRDLTTAERDQALEQLEAASAPAPPPKDKRKHLLRIATDTSEPYHIRAEAQRILDVGDTMPAADFAYRYAEFIEHQKRTSNADS
jgi:hypothetical protein